MTIGSLALIWSKISSKNTNLHFWVPYVRTIVSYLQNSKVLHVDQLTQLCLVLKTILLLFHTYWNGQKMFTTGKPEIIEYWYCGICVQGMIVLEMPGNGPWLFFTPFWASLELIPWFYTLPTIHKYVYPEDKMGISVNCPFTLLATFSNLLSEQSRF